MTEYKAADNERRLLESKEISNLDELKNEISTCLAENHQVWLQYGPLSDNARNNPHSEEIYDMWFSVRLSVIVPNNRVIVGLLKTYRNLFSRSNQPIISGFINHADSYEKWVNDEIPYNAVLPFPKDFENLILATTEAGTR